MAEQARKLGINVSAAAREGISAAIRRALGEADRRAYEEIPEEPDEFWPQAEQWEKP